MVINYDKENYKLDYDVKMLRNIKLMEPGIIYLIFIMALFIHKNDFL